VSLRIGGLHKDPEHFAAIGKVRDWTRARFKVPEEAPVLVSEIVCTRPDCAPLETMIAFWMESGDRHHFKIFKPVKEISFDDFPAEWIDDAVFLQGIEGCPCC
jgi:nitrate reductase delta subunit